MMSLPTDNRKNIGKQLDNMFFAVNLVTQGLNIFVKPMFSETACQYHVPDTIIALRYCNFFIHN